MHTEWRGKVGIAAFGSAMPEKGEMDQVVLTYLKKRGYSKAEELLKGEMRQTTANVDEHVADLLLAGNATTLKHILYYSQAENTPDTYATSYRYLKRWIESCLDVYKAELQPLLFAVFVHCFLSLVERGFPQDATKFMAEFKGTHRETYPREINALLSLCYPEDVDRNEVAKRFKEYRVDIQISSYAHQLLLTFLQECKFYLLLKLINENMNLQISAAKPLHTITTDNLRVSMPGSSHDPNLAFGALPELAQDRDVADARIPMPKLSEEQRELLLDQMQRRVPVTRNDHPSVCMYTFLNSSERLNAVRLSSTGRYVSAGFTDSTMKLWDLESGNDPVSLLGHSASVHTMDFSPDNRYMLSGSADNSIRLWLLRDQVNVVAYKGHNHPIWDVRFSQLGHYFASASNDGTMRLWSTERIYPLRIFAGHVADVECLAFHPNGNYLATGSSDCTVRLWDAQSGDCVRLFTGHQNPIRSTAISPNGKIAVSGDEAGDVRVWDIASGREIAQLQGHRSCVRSVAFDSTGCVLVSGSTDESVRFWDMEGMQAREQKLTQDTRNPLLHTFETKTTPVTHVQFTPADLVLAAGVFTA